MMNMDMARAGGEGVVGIKKKSPEMGDSNNALSSGPQIFETEEQELSIKVPEGWHAKRME